MKEQQIQKNGIKFIEGEGGYCVKVIQASKAGTADTINCVPVTITEEMVGKTVGLFVAIEYKTPKGKVSPLQEYHVELVHKAGGLAFIARSVDDVRKVLD